MFLCGNAGKEGKKGEMKIETQEPGIRALAGSRSWAEVNMCKCSLSMENQNGIFFYSVDFIQSYLWAGGGKTLSLLE